MSGPARADAFAARAVWPRAIQTAALAVLLVPVGAGVAGALLPAFGYLPPLGGHRLTLDHWRELLAWPGLGAAVRLSLVTGVMATALSLAITLLIVAGLQGTRAFAAILRMLAPLLAVPHAAAAFGLAFLIAPSGWIARALSPWATGWERPPDLLTVNDPAGLALVAGLVLKEVPFLLLMTVAALAQADSLRRRTLAETLGYGRVAAWFLVVLPGVYPQIRLPVYAVLAYSMSVVDMALILGPTRPPPLAVVILDWTGHPDLAMRFRAAAAAVLQLLLVVGAIGAWWAGERLVARAGRALATSGWRAARADAVLRGLAAALAAAVAGVMAAGLAGLVVWSFAGLWQFPAFLPESYTLRSWTQQGRGFLGATRETVLIASFAAAFALLLAIGWLEAGYRRSASAGGVRGGRSGAAYLIYIPLIVPQVAFLPGLQWLALVAGFDGGRGVVIAAHLVFVLPYVMLVLSDPWNAWDKRAGTVAATLGAGPWRVLLAVRLPMLLRPVLTAAAVGFAVSVAQYLPTIIIGGGRVDTLTTEAVALASGANRRVIGVYAAMQMLTPLAVFVLALAVPVLVFRNRRGLAI